jgi:uncharacterized LabA/DUF88 family protein
MMQVAIFVDAGYLFAAGSVAVAGRTVSRSELALDVRSTVAALRSIAAEAAPGARLLRIYWYDGSIAGGRPTSDQSLIANTDDVKLRLGHVNSKGEQKEVDSFIVTDLVELARVKSISDAVILAGDADLRVGVAIAQNYGVRVHLLGIAPANSNQSPQLRDEADTKRVWEQEILSRLLWRRESLVAVNDQEPGWLEKSGLKGPKPEGEALVLSAVATFVSHLTNSDLEKIAAYWNDGNRGLPPDLDGSLLRACAGVVKRSLADDERRAIRKACAIAVKSRAAAKH